ncbi:hypothetical protein CPB83DRAFT_854240 [Crepidotus variabilis]|uniref:DUF6533 domain-containing protein n=1 Tax=Crepidotus variabilis TaxID=179855 RepID=A0A9P6EFB8_9AGAR|nr:hypothetical protein CPB83DRAFT_854240 [Crepidotus variabilis]
MTGTATQPDAEDRRIVNLVKYVIYSCITFLAWEWCITFGFELQSIWRKTTPKYTKIVFAFPRYIAIISLTCNAMTLHRIHAIYNVDPEDCRLWQGLQALSAESMMVCLEVLLLTRLYALFERNCTFGCRMFAVLCLKIVAIVALDTFTIRNKSYGDACLAHSSPKTIIYSAVLGILMQTLIWSLTLYKHIRMYLDHGRKDIPLLSLVTRDGSWAFALVTVVCVGSLADAIIGIGHTTSNRPVRDLVYTLNITIISFVSSRLILNVQEFQARSLHLGRPRQCVDTIQIDTNHAATTIPLWHHSQISTPTTT